MQKLVQIMQNNYATMIIICILYYNIMFQGLNRNAMSCGDLNKLDLDYSCYDVMLIKLCICYNIVMI